MIDNTAPKETAPVEPVYDATEAVEKEIAPLIRRLWEACQKSRVPMLCSVAYVNNRETTKFRTSTTSHQGWVPDKYRLAFAVIRAEAVSGCLVPIPDALAEKLGKPEQKGGAS